MRDMLWAVASPPLMSQQSSACSWPQDYWFRQAAEASLSWMQQVDRDPQELEALLAQQKDRRLGKYFETLWYYWLHHQSRYEVVENNVQINIDGETLGEIDFIVFDKLEKKTLHWELAVKFYLGVDDTRDMANWHGPNLRDRLDIKVGHLLNRQSVLAEDKRVTQWLKQQGIYVDHCAVILKGRLYFPWRIKLAGYSLEAMLPLKCSRNLLHGWWLKESEFDDAFDDQEHFLPLINEGWLERISTQSTNNVYAKRGIFEAVSGKEIRFPLHVQLCNPRYDWDRVFITGQKWPHLIS